MKKVICFGTFDILHLGHLNYLKQAKRYGDYLIVVVARDKTKQKQKKKLIFNEKERFELIKSLKIVDKAVLGDLKNFLKPIQENKPDVVCLGYDHKIDEKELTNKLKELNLTPEIKMMKSYNKNKFKSTLFRNSCST
ncbi:MAG: adenylyltransferase/cytidyltransferase family protein [Nanoarchaeota archaeon]|nr:FAD synthase [Nanoarchaeota archaeon]MBU1632148.1 FAD synthase [Nanoarchaeota archaeon]MBU1876349.1 FAD synthase [Nanoarchaeota archaeon]